MSKFFFGGGLNENQVPHIAEAATGSQNFDLAKDSSQLAPRKVFDLKATAPNAHPIQGLMQLIKRDDTQTQLVQAGATVYNWDGASAFTSVGTVDTSSGLRDVYWSLGDYLVITDIEKKTEVKKWDGSALGTLTTSVGGNPIYAKYSVVHLGRVWLFNVKCGADTPHLMVASGFEDPTSYSTTLRAGDTNVVTGLEAFYMLTPDLRPINGVVEFNKQLVISTQGGALFRLTGTSGKDFAWVNYYPASNTVGGESMVGIGNDVMYMKRGGGIDLLSAVQQSSDIAADDVSRFIPTSTGGLSAAIAVYEQAKQKVLFFVSSAVLVFFKDIFYGGALTDDNNSYAKLSPWSVYKTSHSSALNVSAAKYMRVASSNTYTVYFGGPQGQVFDVNGTGPNGDGGTTSVQVIRKTRIIDARDRMNFMKHIVRGTVQYRRTNQVNLSITLDFADEQSSSTVNLTLNGAPAGATGTYYGGQVYYGGNFYYSAGFAFVGNVSHKQFSHVGRGSGCTMTVSTENTLSYQVDHIELI